MEEGDKVATSAGAGRLVDQLEAGLAALDERGVDVGDAVGDVVESGAALGQELADGAIRPGRREQLDPLLAAANQRRLGTLVVKSGAQRDGQAERAGIEGKGLVE